MKHLTILFIAGCLALCTSLRAQSVSGTIRDAKTGEPLVGAIVFVPGTSQSALTDLDGNYTLEAKKGEILNISLLGYKNITEKIGSSLVMDFAMETDNVLEELVVVGYGTVKKKDVLGSVSTIREQTLSDRTSGNLVESLQGLTSGVKVTSSGEPGSSSSIQIRGIGSFTGNKPLFIIDGSYGGDELGVNVEDIESIQILKDASSASIYGSRAASGVVIITTKKGRSGALKVKGDAQAKVYWLPRYDLMNAATYKKYDDRAYAEAMLQGVRGVTSYQDHYTADTDWQGEMLSTGILQNYNLSMSGGAETLNFYASLNYKYDKGALYHTGYDHLGFRVNSSGKKGIFEYGEHLFFNKSNTKKLQGNPWANFISMPPTIPVYDESHPGGYGYGDLKHANSYGLNPVAQENLVDAVNRQAFLIGDIYGLVHIYKDILTTKLNVSYRNYFGETDQLRKKGNWVMGQGDDAAHLNYQTAKHTQLVVENTWQFNYEIANHNINLMAGASYDTFREDYHSETKLDPLVVNGNYIRSINSATGTQTCTGSYIEYALVSFFGRVNYSWNDRYLLQLTARRDGTSRLPAKNRWGNFGSASLGWRISQEPFFKVPWVDELKIRANYGTLGNTNIGAWDYQTNINTAPRAIMDGDRKVIGMTQSNLSNDNLVWEKKTTANAGIDFVGLKRQLSVSAEYYYAKSSDLLLALPVLMTTGNEGGAPMVNAGSLQNTGFELEVGWNSSVGDFTYSVNANFSTVHNKVLDLGYGQTVYYTAFSKSEIGQPLGMWYLYKTLGIFQSQEEIDSYVSSDGTVIQPNARPGDIIYDDYNDDGQISSEDRQLVGSPWAKLQMGLNFSVGWRGIELGVSTYGRFGQLVYNGAKATAADFSTNQNNFNGYKPWTQENPSQINPRLLYGDTRNSRSDQDRWLEDGSFYKIDEISLSWSMPAKWINKIGFEQIKMSVIGKNLITFTRYTGLDPEFADGGIYTIGYDNCSFPNPRSVQFAVSFTF